MEKYKNIKHISNTKNKKENHTEVTAEYDQRCDRGNKISN